MRVRLGLALAAVLGLATTVFAEPIDLKQISGDAKWAAHLDIDALKNSALAKKAHEKFLKEHPEAERHMAFVRQLWKFNPMTDLHSVTIYGRQLKKNTGVAIVRAKVDQKMLLDKAKFAPDHRVSTYGKYELHSWIHDKGSKHERTMAGTFYKPEVMIFGATSEELMAAIDVLDGKTPSFASVKPEAAGVVPAGSILVIGVTGVANADLPCKCPLSKKVDSAIVAVGESNGNVFVQGKLLTKETETAQQVKAVLDGAVALATLAKSDDAELVKLINTVKVDVADKCISVDANAAVDVVWAHAQKAAAKAKEAHKKGWPPCGPKHCGPKGKK